MKHYITLLLLLAFSNSSLYSQKLDSLSCKVGKQPVSIMGDKIFCLGYDANWNGVYEPEQGDELPSVWRYYPQEVTDPYHDTMTCDKIREFPFGSLKHPFRIAYNSFKNTYYINHNNFISVYDSDLNVLKDTLLQIDASALHYEGYLFISERRNDSGFVHVYNTLKDEMVDTFVAGKNVQEVIFFDDNLYILSEGDFGSGNSTIKRIDLNAFDYEETVFEVGDGANDLFINESIFHPTLLVTANGSHQIFVIDIDQNQITDTINTNTSGFDGPRNIIKYNYENDIIYLVSTYAGELQIYSNEGEYRGNLFELEGKIEEVKAHEPLESYISLAVPNNADYSPNDTVYFLAHNLAWSVPESPALSPVKAYPNPAKDHIMLEYSTKENVFELQGAIYDLSGRRVVDIPRLPVGEKVNAEIKLGNLNNGQYYLKLSSNGMAETVKINVIK